MTTDLFFAAAGLDALGLERAAPPDCLRGVNPATPATREDGDTIVTSPPWAPRRPASHLLPSFAPLTEAALTFRLEMSALVDGEWSTWVGGATVGRGAFAPLPAAAPPLACDVDVFSATPAVDAVRLRVRVRGELGTCWLLALSAADAAPPDLRVGDGGAVGLAVPALSQHEADAALGARICSPTSVAMVLGYWGRAASPAALAAEVFDAALDIYGVWPSAVRAAAARGVAGYLLRFPDWGAARWCLQAGIPIVASVRYAAGELTDAAIAATPGHLLVMRGIENGEVLVNDPAAARAGAVPRRYRADEFARVWLGRGGVGYVLFDPARV